MSFIIGAGNNQQIWLASDGRRCDTDEEGNIVILDEKHKKIIRCHNQLLIAYAGTLEHCLRPLIEIGKPAFTNVTVEQATSLLKQWIEEHYDYREEDIDAQYIIAGVNSFGLLKMNALRCFEHTMDVERHNLAERIEYTTCSCLDPDDDFVKPIMESDGDVPSHLKQCIIEAAQRSSYINANYFDETIELCDH